MTIQDEIKQLKEKKQAVILAHYYTRPEVQEIADFLAGDVHTYPLDRKEMEKCRKFIIKNASDRYYRKLMYENAEYIINGGQI